MSEEHGGAEQTVTSLDHACMLVGKFLWRFAQLEAAVDRGMQQHLSIEDAQADIVCANVDFFRKLKTVRSAIALQVAENDAEINAEIKKVFSQIAAINDSRKVMAHCGFDVEEGRVKFRRSTADTVLRRDDPSWSAVDFENYDKRISETTEAIQRLCSNIKPYREALTYKYEREQADLALQMKRKARRHAIVYGSNPSPYGLDDLRLDDLHIRI